MSQDLDIKRDIRYLLKLDGDVIPVESSLTVGRQLDNDLVVAGEDVLDFHIRIEPTERGLTVIPLGEASLTLNDKDFSEAVSLVVGDSLRVGQNDIVFGVEMLQPNEADEWWLHADREETIYKVTGELGVGRGDDNEILLLDDHVSRRHATLHTEHGVVWLRDLGSANGTFVNGERIVGGCRLFHGDELTFDTLRFQLIGKGEDLTAVRRQETADESALILEQPQSDNETTEIMAVDVTSQPPLVIPESSETGAFLLGVSDPVAGLTFRTTIGRNTIGRSEDCDIVLRDSTVSIRHAEIIARAEGCTVTNLMATNGTKVNGQQVQSAQLKDGDMIRIGQISLVFRDIPKTRSSRFSLPRARWIILGVSLTLAAVVIWMLS
jgi:pSer/pThr/pTyr-binding forkhead associated (FHA) protein